MKIEYKVKAANETDIAQHLRRTNNFFSPPLDSYVNIDDYAYKLYEKALTFEAWDSDKLIGLAAAYFNNYSSKNIFFTNLSLEIDYQGIGIATELFKCLLEMAKEKGFETITLEVKKTNDKVYSFHIKNGFLKVGENNDCFTMIYKVK